MVVLAWVALFVDCLVRTQSVSGMAQGVVVARWVGWGGGYRCEWGDEVDADVCHRESDAGINSLAVGKVATTIQNYVINSRVQGIDVIGCVRRFLLSPFFLVEATFLFNLILLKLLTHLSTHF